MRDHWSPIRTPVSANTEVCLFGVVQGIIGTVVCISVHRYSVGECVFCVGVHVTAVVVIVSVGCERWISSRCR